VGIWSSIVGSQQAKRVTKRLMNRNNVVVHKQLVHSYTASSKNHKSGMPRTSPEIIRIDTRDCWV